MPTPARCPGRCPPTPVTTRPRRWPICRPWAQTRSSRRKRPATATNRRPRHEDASPRISHPETGCAASCRPSRGRQRYALRMGTVEPVFGQIKQGRGFRQFLLRGLEKVQGEWSLICTGHNLLKLFRFGGRARGKGRPPHIPTPGFFPGRHSIRGTA